MKYIELTQIGLTEDICKHLEKFHKRKGDIDWLSPDEIFHHRDPSIFGPRGFIVLGRNGRGAAIGVFSKLYGFPEVDGIYQRENAGGEIWKITDLDLKKIFKNKYPEEELEENIEFPPHDTLSYNSSALDQATSDILSEALKPIWYNWPIWEDTNKRKALLEEIGPVLEQSSFFETGSLLDNPQTWIAAAKSEECSDPDLQLKLLDNALTVTEFAAGEEIWETRKTIWEMMASLGSDLNRKYASAQPSIF